MITSCDRLPVIVGISMLLQSPQGHISNAELPRRSNKLHVAINHVREYRKKQRVAILANLYIRQIARNEDSTPRDRFSRLRHCRTYGLISPWEFADFSAAKHERTRDRSVEWRGRRDVGYTIRTGLVVWTALWIL